MPVLNSLDRSGNEIIVLKYLYYSTRPGVTLNEL